MTLYSAAFCFFSFLIVAGGVGMLLVRNLLHAAFCLLMVLMGIAALYVLLAADLLAVIQVMVYVGGVLVLLIFGVMMSSRAGAAPHRAENHNVWWGAVIGVLAISGLTWFLGNAARAGAFPDTEMAEHWKTSVGPIGQGLLTTFALPFELVSVLLLIALIGASFVASRRKTE
jgi:NADH:ubiquinone oxidoreductase subunit 6 (subunit J)